MSDDHPGYATVREVARIYRISTGYVYRLANRDRWRRYTMDGQVRYHRDDVAATLDKQ